MTERKLYSAFDPASVIEHDLSGALLRSLGETPEWVKEDFFRKGRGWICRCPECHAEPLGWFSTEKRWVVFRCTGGHHFFPTHGLVVRYLTGNDSKDIKAQEQYALAEDVCLQCGAKEWVPQPTEPQLLQCGNCDYPHPTKGQW